MIKRGCRGFEPQTRKKIQLAGAKYLQDESNGCVASNFNSTYIYPFGLGNVKGEWYRALWHGEISESDFCRMRNESTNRRRKCKIGGIINDSENEKPISDVYDNVADTLSTDALLTLLRTAHIVMEREKIDSMTAYGVSISYNRQ